MKITDSLINPCVGLTVRVWLDGDVMKMAVPGITETIFFHTNSGVEIRISGQGNQPVEVSTYRVVTGPLRMSP